MLFLGDYNNFATETGKLAEGLGGGEGLLNGISGLLSGTSRIGKALNKIAPFFGAFSAIAGIVGFYGDSGEVQRLDQVIEMLNEGFKGMNERFDRFETRVDQLEAVLKEESFWTRLNDKILDLVSVEDRVKDYFNGLSPANRAAALQRLDDDEYDKTYDAVSALHAYFGNSLPTRSICESVIDFSAVNRSKVMQISVDLYSRLLSGARNKVLISELRNYADKEEIKQKMIRWMTEVGQRIDACDADIRESRWIGQWKKDLLNEILSKDIPSMQGGRFHNLKVLMDTVNNWYKKIALYFQTSTVVDHSIYTNLF